ncbi:MAG: bifunctional oligoribonuclease/PAP phosphatase NrnA [Planctomycetaceae bacterium]|nr:bifunctional oligoribonuclease/PAP phosphatase NrnA [Planctomycetaceae bacterium]
MTIDWRPLQELIASHERFVLTSHVRPDADAIGSEMGMALLLESLGKTVRIANPSATPNHLKFLDPEGRILKLGEGIKPAEVRETEVHLILDTSSWQQLADFRKVLESTPARKIVIDHHVSSDDLGAVEFKDVTASATGVLVAEFAAFLGITPTRDMAEKMYCAIATDTGWFRFSNTDARTLRTAAWLIDCGVEPNLLYQQLYERSSLARLKLHGIVLSRVAVTDDGRLAHTYVLQQDFKETGSHPSDTEDLVNDCLTIEGTECAFIIVEQMSGQVKISFRSRSELDVAAVAEQFGGGGHKKASGAMLPGPLATAQQRVLQAMLAAMTPQPVDAPPVESE